MDYRPGIRSPYLGGGIPAGVPRPFYMTYPGYLGAEQERSALRDLEYLQQTYPRQVKGYLRRIADILDKMDYEGSMIYDEYPDRLSLQRLTGSILEILKHEEQNQQAEGDRKDAEEFPEKWEWLEWLVQVLVCNEVYKRRHGGRRGFIKF